MRFVLPLGLAGLFVLAAGCTGRADATGERSTLADTTAAPDTLATLERTRCFGTCPSYTLTIYRDGTVEYGGRAYVATEGRATARLDSAAVERLVRAFQETDYFALENSYVSGPVCARHMTDMPTVTTSFHYEDRHKRIEHYHGCRGFAAEEKLTALENAIDEIAGTKRWVE